MYEDLKALQELRDNGTITEDEFETKKREILERPASSSSEKNKMVAGLLAIFLGGLGIHKFYLGYSKAGVIMICVTILGSFLLFLGPIIMGVIGLIEGIMYLMKSDAEFEQIYVVGQKEWF